VLEELLIRDVGVIDEVSLRIGGGLTVVTGETGAGKTMVVSALELLLGARADATRVRGGAERALVEGRLTPPPPGSEEWLDDGDEDLVVSREVSVGGDATRSRARIGGRPAPASALSGLLGGVVEVHGQGDAHRLADPTRVRELLDRSGGAALQEVRAAYGEIHHRWRTAAMQLRDLEEGDRDRARELDRLRAEVEEIAAFDPVAGEDETLAADLRRLEHAEHLVAAAQTAAGAVFADGGARDTVGVAVSALRDVSGLDPALTELHERAEGVAAELQDLALELTHYAEGLDLDPGRLDALRARQAGLRSLTRKYGEDAAAVLAYAEEARARIAALDGGVERIAELRAEATELERRLHDAADRLRAARVDAGMRLSASVEEHLRDLAMGDARFTVEVTATEPGPAGADRVGFLLAAGAGQPSLPVARAASGGERSRVALALRLSLTAADEAEVLVFDEVDAGVGGAVALAIGEKLARLAQGRQVLCVTHLAQLAAYADDHLVVAKHTHGGRTTARLERLTDDDARLRELSRLLSGTPDSERAAEHAAELRARARARLAPTPT
jgi:DNA repair protein RecN (Recombination protein N)